MALRYAPSAFQTVNSALNDNVNPPHLLLSCAALLAGKMGASDLHMVMVSGFAGGIGLCGGGCGALAAAIWLKALKHEKKGESQVAYNDSIALQVIDRFVSSSNNEFECSKIVGRRVESVSDHAGYIQQGGCLEIIQILGAC